MSQGPIRLERELPLQQGGRRLERELARQLDKTEQTGDWTQRPLTEPQITYAALDVEVLLRLNEHFQVGLSQEERRRLSTP